MIAATPWQGGAAWAVLQYLLGLRRLGCSVYFMEPIDRARGAVIRRPPLLRAGDGAIRLEDRWALIPPRGADPIGMRRSQVESVAREADLLLNVAGMLSDPDVLDPIPVRAYLDLDPVFTQLWHAAEGVDMRLDGHTHFVTIADAIGRADDTIPSCGRDWLPTLPPVVLEEWPVATRLEHRAVTTVGHWRSYGSIHHQGSPVRPEGPLAAAADRPAQSVLSPLRAGARNPSRRDRGPRRPERERLDSPRSGGGGGDPGRLSPLRAGLVGGVRAHQGGLRRVGLGLVQRPQRLLSRLGSAGDRPGHRLRPPPSHRHRSVRLLTAEDAVAAIEELQGDYERHRAAARELATTHLDSDRILGALVERLCR